MTPRDGTAGRRGVGGQVQRVNQLAAEASAAARVRELTTHPDVIALRVERVRAQVDALLWAGIVLGLAFTMVNVQSFAAAGAQVWSLEWLVAWLLDPMVSLVLLAVLRAEQVTARYQVSLPAWARRTKWLTFGATYVMNTWTSWGLDSGAGAGAVSWSGVVLHSVPPLVVFATAETGPGLRDRLTEAVHRALIEHRTAQGVDAVPGSSTSALTGGVAEGAEFDETDTNGLDEGPAGTDRVELDPIALGLVDEHGLSQLWKTAPPAPPTKAQLTAALIAEGAGRRRLARELDISEYEARQLLARTRTATPADHGGTNAATDDGETAPGFEQVAEPARVHAINGAGINGTSYGTGGGTS